MTAKQLIRIAALLGVAVFFWGMAVILRGGSDAVERVALLGPFVEEQIDRIEIAGPADTIMLERTGSGWRVNGYEADRTQIEDLFGGVGSAVEGELIARNPSSHARMGVDGELGKRIQLFQGGQPVADLIAGNMGNKLRSMYVRLAGEDFVYLIEGEVTTVFTKRLKDWRNKRIIDVEGAEIRAFEVTRSGTRYRVEDSDSGWVFASGEETDTAAVRRYVEKFHPLSAQGDLFATPEQVDSLDFDNPDRRLRLEGGDGVILAELLLEESSNESGFWVREAQGGIVYYIMQYKANEILPMPAAFRTTMDSTVN